MLNDVTLCNLNKVSNQPHPLWPHPHPPTKIFIKCGIFPWVSKVESRLPINMRLGMSVAHSVSSPPGTKVNSICPSGTAMKFLSASKWRQFLALWRSYWDCERSVRQGASQVGWLAASSQHQAPSWAIFSFASFPFLHAGDFQPVAFLGLMLLTATAFPTSQVRRGDFTEDTTHNRPVYTTSQVGGLITYVLREILEMRKEVGRLWKWWRPNVGIHSFSLLLNWEFSAGF